MKELLTKIPSANDKWYIAHSLFIMTKRENNKHKLYIKKQRFLKSKL